MLAVYRDLKSNKVLLQDLCDSNKEHILVRVIYTLDLLRPSIENLYFVKVSEGDFSQDSNLHGMELVPEISGMKLGLIYSLMPLLWQKYMGENDEDALTLLKSLLGPFLPDFSISFKDCGATRAAEEIDEEISMLKRDFNFKSGWMIQCQNPVQYDIMFVYPQPVVMSKAYLLKDAATADEVYRILDEKYHNGMNVVYPGRFSDETNRRVIIISVAP